VEITHIIGRTEPLTECEVFKRARGN
jgi:hypothetical protein